MDLGVTEVDGESTSYDDGSESEVELGTWHLQIVVNFA